MLNLIKSFESFINESMKPTVSYRDMMYVEYTEKPTNEILTETFLLKTKNSVSGERQAEAFFVVEKAEKRSRKRIPERFVQVFLSETKFVIIKIADRKGQFIDFNSFTRDPEVYLREDYCYFEEVKAVSKPIKGLEYIKSTFDHVIIGSTTYSAANKFAEILGTTEFMCVEYSLKFEYKTLLELATRTLSKLPNYVKLQELGFEISYDDLDPDDPEGFDFYRMLQLKLPPTAAFYTEKRHKIRAYQHAQKHDGIINLTITFEGKVDMDSDFLDKSEFSINPLIDSKKINIFNFRSGKLFPYICCIWHTIRRIKN